MDENDIITFFDKEEITSMSIDEIFRIKDIDEKMIYIKNITSIICNKDTLFNNSNPLYTSLLNKLLYIIFYNDINKMFNKLFNNNIKLIHKEELCPIDIINILNDTNSLYFNNIGFDIKHEIFKIHNEIYKYYILYYSNILLLNLNLEELKKVYSKIIKNKNISDIMNNINNIKKDESKSNA